MRFHFSFFISKALATNQAKLAKCYFFMYGAKALS